MSSPKLQTFHHAMALALPALCLLCTHARAADEAVAVLPAVIVTGTPDNISPAPGATWVNKTTLAPKLAATSDTACLLSDIPGLSLYGAGGVSSLPVIHGLADDRLRIQVDGMDLIASCPNHMNPALSYIDPSQVDVIKVYAGITPVSVGGDSIGGSIAVSSRAPEFAAPGQAPISKGEVGTFYRSNNNARGLNLSATYATDSFNISYSAATAKADNYTAAGDFKTSMSTGRAGHTLPLDEVGSSAYDTRNQTLALAYKNDNHLFEAKFGVQDMPYQLYPNQRMDLLKNDQNSVNLRYLGQFDWGALEARAYHENVDHFMDFGADKQFFYGPNLPSTIVAPGMPMYTQGKTTGLSVKADKILSPTELLRLGVDLQQYRLNDWWPPSPSSLDGMVSAPGVPATSGGMAPDTFWNIRDGQRDRTALFAELESKLDAQWLTLLGLRYERVTTNTGNVQGYNTVMAGYAASAAAFNAREHRRTDHNWDLTALARYTQSERSDVEFGFSRKTRSPNLYERYSWSQNSMALEMNNFVGDGNGYLGNLDLKPEVAHTLSATLDVHAPDRAWGFKATPYFTQVSNYIDAVRCAGSGTMMNALCSGAGNATAVGKFVNLQYANQPARLYGVDLSGHMPLANNAWGQFGFKGLLNYTHGTNRDTGDALYNVMPLNAKLALTQKLAGWDNSLELVMVQAKDSVSSVRNEVKTPGYSLVNLRASHSWKTVRLDFGVENLLDKFYSLPTGGAYTGQGSTMSINGIPYGIAVPGAGRSVYVGLNLKF
ncbi:TonB-dependent receptor [Rhodoferax sp. U11-2br]|uniref:TonB-dependent receptor n=1 Tax=Rhodoferax sp. U11-2br TaxID=2838878 RepID=UPI001BE8B650|nr:TonB-dependent receptor [Rhodoferax sp. U11-2br]MBT3067746.1 TonB-dependent receptor [Rhodoferax sp. U11-2br]